MNKTFTGKVVSTKMQNTVVILIETKYRHPLYKKVIFRHKKIKAHNTDTKIKEGDIITVRETRPISKDKNFIVVTNEEVQKTEKKVESKPEVQTEVANAETSTSKSSSETKQKKTTTKKTVKSTKSKATKSAKEKNTK